MNDPATLELASAVDRLAMELRELTLKLTTGHMEDPDSAESFLESAQVTCVATSPVVPIVPSRTLVLTVTPPETMSGTLYELSLDLATPYAWADDSLAGGVYFQVAVGGEVRPHLATIRKPRSQGRTFVAFDRRRKLEIWAVNTDTTRAIVACVGVAGFFRDGLGAVHGASRQFPRVA